MTTATTSKSDSATKVSSLKLRAGRLARYLVPMACSALLMVWLFHKVDFHKMLEVLHHNVDYWPLIIMMCITMLSHVIRGLRWGLQLAGAGIVCRKSDLIVSIFGNYSLNLLFPRAGEVWRCVFIRRRQHCRMSTVVGTLVGDRASDAFVVLLLLGLTLVVAHGAISRFLEHYSVGEEISRLSADPWTWCAVAGVVALVWGVFYLLRNTRAIRSTDRTLRSVWAGFAVLFRMPHKWEFTWLTIGIWVCYYLQIYTAFFAFPFTRELIIEPGTAYGLIPGLVAFVFSSFSMAIPSNGGLGPWNLTVMFALTLFGIGQTEAAAFAMMVWSFESLILVVLGIYTAIYVAATEPKTEQSSAQS